MKRTSQFFKKRHITTTLSNNQRMPTSVVNVMVSSGAVTSTDTTSKKMGSTNGFRLHGETSKAYQKITESQTSIINSLKQ